MRTSERMPSTGAVAYWSVLGLGALSTVVRPVVQGLGLPSALRNVDALLTPVAVAAVCALALMRRRDLAPGAVRVLATFGAVVMFSMLSWAVSTPRSVISLGLAFTSLLMLPCALVLVVFAASYDRRTHLVPLLRVLVLLQLIVGIGQYLGNRVAATAPIGADLVDGTTSHNFWPAFALPASAALLLLDRSRTRWLWPLSVGVLAVYAEAKAALLVFTPIVVAVAAADKIRSLERRRLRGAITAERLTRAGVVVATFAILGTGLWFTPSVQGTWQVLVGHTRDATALVENTAPPDKARVTLRQGLPVLAEAVTGSAATFMLGLGPANTVSHAADVLVQRSPATTGASAAGPVAERLLTHKGDLQFEDAQSSLLGVWGDIGLLGSVAYLALLASALHALTGGRIEWPRNGHKKFLILAIIVGIMAGGGPLDWPEQASIVLPLLLPVLALADAKGHAARLSTAAAVVRLPA